MSPHSLLVAMALGFATAACGPRLTHEPTTPPARSDTPAGSVMAGIVDPGPAPARPVQLADPALRVWLSRSIARCDRAVATVAYAEKRAYAQRDVILVNALRDKNAALQIARRMMVERAAALRGSDDPAEQMHDSIVIDVLNQRVGVLVREAQHAICEYPADA